MGHSRIDECVEILCQKGCQAVRRDIQSLEAGCPLPETRGLNPKDVQRVLRELKNIMAVYGDSCRI